MFGSWVLNKIWIIYLSSALVDMLISWSKLFLFTNTAHLNSGVRLLLDLYCVIVIKHVAFFTTCAKLLATMAFTFTFLDVIVISGWRKILTDRRIWQKKARDGGFAYPIHPPHYVIYRMAGNHCIRFSALSIFSQTPSDPPYAGEFWNANVFTSKTLQMFFVHTMPKKFGNTTINDHFGLVSEENSGRVIAGYRNVIVSQLLPFWVFSNFSGLKSDFEKLTFRGRLVWTVGLTVEIKLCFMFPG